jgi:hypothetical protein
MLVLLFILFASPASARTLPIVTFRGYDGDIADLREGYLVDDTVDLWLTPGLPSRHTYYTPSPVHFSTRALWQNRGVMQASARYNGVDLSDVAGGIALMSPTDVGRFAFVRAHGGDWTATRVGDTVNRLHLYYHVATVRSAVELSYELAEQLGVLGYNAHGGVGAWEFEVCVSNDLSACAGAPIPYTDWFLSVLRFE